MTESSGTRPTPPYVAFPTFKGFIDKLRDSVVPTQIDNTVLDKYSGTAKLALKPALKFLGLIEEDHTSTDRLRRLVKARQAGDQEWYLALRELLEQTYGDIVAGVDLKHGTVGNLETVFKDRAGVDGSVRQKAIRFYLYALQDAGVEVSPHMKGRRGGAGGTRKPRKARKPKDATSPTPPTPPAPGSSPDHDRRQRQDEPPEGHERLAVPGYPDTFIQYPVDLSDQVLGLLKAHIATLDFFVQVQSGKGGR